MKAQPHQPRDEFALDWTILEMLVIASLFPTLFDSRGPVMKCPWPLLAVLTALLVASVASAQDPTDFAPPTQVLIPAIASAEPEPKGALDNSFALQFGIGLPFEARVEFPFGASGRHYYEAELEADAFIGPTLGGV